MISLALASLVAVSDISAPLTLPSEPAPLHGTLLRPAGESVAAALIIPGSGPTDRDGNSPLGVRNSTLKQLAEGLASYNIATVRIDKRGIAASTAAGRSEAELNFDQMAQDVRDWATLAARETGKPCVWLIGHSEGALVAQVAASRRHDDICGLVLLAGLGQPPAKGLAEQLQALPEPLYRTSLDILSSLENGQTVADVPPALAPMFRASVQPYLISWFKHDPARLAADYEGPMFIGNGTTDLQVPAENARKLHAAYPLATLRIWEGVNHLMVPAPEDRAANAATYTDPDAKLADNVVVDIAEFVRFNSVQ